MQDQRGSRNPAESLNLSRLDREDCKRCQGSGFVVEAEPYQPGVFTVKKCPEGCNPEYPVCEFRLPAVVGPLTKIKRLTPADDTKSRVISVGQPTPEG